MGLEVGGGFWVWPAAAVAVSAALKGLTRDSKVNPDVLLLLISLADEWEGKITGASQGGPVCCPATQALPSSPPQLRQPQQKTVSGERPSASLHVASACQTTSRQVDRQAVTFTSRRFSTAMGQTDTLIHFHLGHCSESSQNEGVIPDRYLGIFGDIQIFFGLNYYYSLSLKI